MPDFETLLTFGPVLAGVFRKFDFDQTRFLRCKFEKRRLAFECVAHHE